MRAILTVVTAALKAVVEHSGYLEIDEGARAVVAAEVVAALFGQASPILPDEVGAWVRERPVPFYEGLIQLALDAITRVETPSEDVESASELQEAWEDAASYEGWLAAMADLRRRLERCHAATSGH